METRGARSRIQNLHVSIQNTSTASKETHSSINTTAKWMLCQSFEHLHFTNTIKAKPLKKKKKPKKPHTLHNIHFSGCLKQLTTCAGLGNTELR